MQLDVRLPIGYMFVIFGAVLAIFGIVSPGGKNAHQLFGADINLSWGLVQFAFGVLMLALAFRGKKKAAKE